MNRSIKIILAVLMTFVISIRCNKQPSNPEKKAVQFNFIFQKADDAEAQSSSALPIIASPASALQKALDLQTFEMVRIMVIDLSEYEDWENFADSSETGRAYMANRAVWDGDRGNWAEWKKFWQDYATIVVDQTLEIQATEAVGTVAGVIGLNEFVAALFQNGRVRWWVSGEGYGEEGETHDVPLTWWMEVPPLDPCLAKSMDKSPEEAVFNAAFGK
jgi:hypothetical protein